MDNVFNERLADLAFQANVGWCAAALSIILLGILMARLGRHFASQTCERERVMTMASRMLEAHRSESATASMEYLLVLVPFLIIVMTVWQLAFMLNARTHVAYAAYAAARSAAVLIPAETDSEPEGTLEPQSGSSSKWSRIRKAAIPGTLAISPGDWKSAGSVAVGAAASEKIGGSGSFSFPSLPDPLGAATRLGLMSMHMCDTPIFCEPQVLKGTRPQRAAVKHYYAENMTRVFIEGQDHKKQQSISQDVVKIRVEYVLWLQVPYVGRMLEALIRGRTNPLTGEAVAQNLVQPSIVLTEETSINTWLKKRATTPCP